MRNALRTSALLCAMLAAPAFAATVEGTVVEVDRTRQLVVVEMDDGRRAGIRVADESAFGDAAGWDAIAQGERIAIEGREVTAEAEAGRTHRADVADARQRPDLDEHTRADGKPYDRLGMMGDGESYDLVLEADRIRMARTNVARADRDQASDSVQRPVATGSRDRAPERADAVRPMDDDRSDADRSRADRRTTQRLPDTAGPLPLLLLLGGAGVVGGLALRARRR